MNPAEWATCIDPARMVRFLTEDDGYGHAGVRLASERQLRLFAAACSRACASSGDVHVDAATWQEWAERRSEGNEYTGADGARFWVGERVGMYPSQTLSKPQKRELANLLREIIGDPFVKPQSLHQGRIFDWLAWNYFTVHSLATQIYRDNNWDLMPILADALEEAGCQSAAILDHCRNVPGHLTAGGMCPLCRKEEPGSPCPHCVCGIYAGGESGKSDVPCDACQGTGEVQAATPHVPGCWVVDCLLGN